MSSRAEMCHLDLNEGDAGAGGLHVHRFPRPETKYVSISSVTEWAMSVLSHEVWWVYTEILMP